MQVSSSDEVLFEWSYHALAMSSVTANNVRPLRIVELTVHDEYRPVAWETLSITANRRSGLVLGLHDKLAGQG